MVDSSRRLQLLYKKAMGMDFSYEPLLYLKPLPSSPPWTRDWVLACEGCQRGVVTEAFLFFISNRVLMCKPKCTTFIVCTLMVILNLYMKMHAELQWASSRVNAFCYEMHTY